jgi:hypothetical protein
MPMLEWGLGGRVGALGGRTMGTGLTSFNATISLACRAGMLYPTASKSFRTAVLQARGGGGVGVALPDADDARQPHTLHAAAHAPKQPPDDARPAMLASTLT